MKKEDFLTALRDKLGATTTIEWAEKHHPHLIELKEWVDFKNQLEINEGVLYTYDDLHFDNGSSGIAIIRFGEVLDAFPLESAGDRI